MNSTQPPPNAANSLSESKEESLEHPTREMMKPAVVLRPTPTLPSGAAFGLRPQGSAFQPPPLRPTASRSPGIAPMVFPTSMGLLPHLPHPARARSGTSPAQPGPNDSLNSLQTMSEDELAATTVGSLSGRREDVVGPTLVPGNQLARHSVKDGTAGEDSMPRLGGQAQQQALMQQQVWLFASPLYDVIILPSLVFKTCDLRVRATADASTRVQSNRFGHNEANLAECLTLLRSRHRVVLYDLDQISSISTTPPRRS